MRRFAAGSLLALAIQPPLFMLWFAVPAVLDGQVGQLADLSYFSLLAAVVALPFVLVVGVPAAIALDRSGRYRWKYFAVIGFLAAAIPAAFLTPLGHTGYSSGGNFYGKLVDFIVDGVPTIYGWLQYAQSIIQFGLHGLIGATAFYFGSRRIRSKSSESQPGAVA